MSAAKPLNTMWDSSWHQVRDLTCLRHLHPEADKQCVYMPPPLQASGLCPAHGDVNPWLQVQQFFHQVENVM